MKYEGKIYGKVAGKFIEVDFPKDLLEFKNMLLDDLKEKEANALEKVKMFEELGMNSAAACSGSMAAAYKVVLDFINNKFQEINPVAQTPTKTPNPVNLLS